MLKPFNYFFATCLLTTTILLGDTAASYPPNPLDARGGSNAPAVAEANAQAIYWINLIDQHQFWASWLEAGGLVQDLVTQKQWATAMREMRIQLGPVTSRRLSFYQATHELPHGTRGNFMIIQFQTNYAKLSDTVETVILMAEGPLYLWKVIAYKIAK